MEVDQNIRREDNNVDLGKILFEIISKMEKKRNGFVL